MSKRTIFINLFFLIFLFSSCEEECNGTTPLVEIILGSWEVYNLDVYLGEIQFRPDGLLDDPDQIFIEGVLNGIEFFNKSYQVIDERFIIIRNTSSGGVSFIEQELEVFAFDCEFIDADLDLSFPFSLQKIY